LLGEVPQSVVHPLELGICTKGGMPKEVAKLLMGGWKLLITREASAFATGIGGGGTLRFWTYTTDGSEALVGSSTGMNSMIP